ncbi:Similar to RER1: Protein RER1 (Bos taurus), partial [Cotesia congregata]
MMQDEDLGGPTKRNPVMQAFIKISQIYQGYLDLWTPHTISRWIFAGFLVILFILRILIAQGWYIIIYALDGEGPELPTKANEEFRPFIRRLPEFKFWYSVTKSTIIALFCTMFELFNIPVFWPILVMYFITLFCITMKRQIKHMIKYRYLPFTHGKPKYQNHDGNMRNTKNILNNLLTIFSFKRFKFLFFNTYFSMINNNKYTLDILYSSGTMIEPIVLVIDYSLRSSEMVARDRSRNVVVEFIPTTVVVVVSLADDSRFLYGTDG